MGTMLTYVKDYADVTFRQMPFNEVDSLILSQIAYMIFDGYVTKKAKFTTSIHFLANLENENFTQNTTLPKGNKALLKALKKNERFGNITLGCYHSETDEEKQLQFAAVTFKITPHLHYIAYRGTDLSLVGWKEDFNLAFSKNIPAQLLALKYLKKTVPHLRGKLLLGGHSKGGNLAEYAAMYAPKRIQRRITAIYNHDGPGFLPEVLKAGKYDRIRDRIYKTVPHASIVGLLLESRESYTVVASKHFPLLQHNPFTWSVRCNDFVRIKKVDFLSTFTQKTLSAWLTTLDLRDRQCFIDTLYDILKSTKATTLPELFAALKKGIGPLRRELNALPPQTKTMLHHAIRTLTKIGTAQMKLMLKKEGTS